MITSNPRGYATVSTKFKLEFNNLQGYQYRKLIIFSDMIQNSVDMELVPSCGNRGNCITYDKLRKNYNDEKWMNLKPILGKSPDVHVYYLACKFDEDLIWFDESRRYLAKHFQRVGT